MSCHLVIPDSHAVHGHNNRRYEWLGHLINEVKPDVVIDIGDWWDFQSLNSYDKSSKKAYNQLSYKKDLEAGLDAQDRMFSIIRRQKRKLPRFVRCLGNHEERIARALESDPILNGVIGYPDLQSDAYGWEQHDFLEQVDIDGVRYSHYFVTGISGKPVSGDNVAKTLLQKQFWSCTQGHSHLFDYAVRTDATGHRLMGLTVGCYVEEHLDWANSMAHLWYQGVAICNNVENGCYDLNFVSMDSIKKAFGNVH